MHGERVTLVEPPGGSALRKMGPFGDEASWAETGAAFLTLAAGKWSQVVDLSRAEGRSAFEALLLDSHVLITDELPALQAAGFEPGSLNERFPGVVVVAVSPCGA